MDDVGAASPLQLLQDDFSSSDQEVRLKAIKRVRIVAEVMGPDATRANLIPFINQIVEDDDELLLALAGELADFVPLVGGPAHAHLLLPCLENLSAVEETVVRDQTVVSLRNVIAACEGHSDDVAGVVKRLSGGDWFTARVSACGVYGAAYRRIAEPELRGQLREQFDALAKDDTPMVRRAAASKLGDFAAAMEADHVVAELLPIFAALAGDDQDSVRQLAIEGTPSLATSLAVAGDAAATAAVVAQVLPAVKRAAEDRSWRVRHGVARSLAATAAAAGAGGATELAPALVGLLGDPETDVRAASIAAAPAFADLLGADAFLRTVTPALQQLQQDSTLPVRNALSAAAMALTPKLGPDGMDQFVLPMLQTFLRDDAPEVRLHVLLKLDALAEWIPLLTDVLLPLVLELGQDGVWRVRQAVVQAIPLLAEKLGATFFEEHMVDLYLKAYEDSVHEVRASASEGLPLLCKACGSDWVLEKLVPRIRAFYDGASFYLIRITVVNAFKRLVTGTPPTKSSGGGGGDSGTGGSGGAANAVGPNGGSDGAAASPMLAPHVIDLMLRAAQDQIPNVRFTAVRALQEMAPHLDDAAVASQVRPILAGLAQQDSDQDVKFFAAAALASLR